MFYEESEICVCSCGYQNIAENLDMDAHLLCVRCPRCNGLMSVDESYNKLLNANRAKPSQTREDRNKSK